MVKLIEDKIPEIHELCKLNHVTELYVFGSATEPARFTVESDLDFLVSFDLDNISNEIYADSYFTLINELEALLSREIDMTTVRSLSNPFFIEELDSTKELVYAQLEEANG